VGVVLLVGHLHFLRRKAGGIFCCVLLDECGWSLVCLLKLAGLCVAPVSLSEVSPPHLQPHQLGPEMQPVFHRGVWAKESTQTFCFLFSVRLWGLPLLLSPTRSSPVAPACMRGNQIGTGVKGP
jgi:hypothetical protein